MNCDYLVCTECWFAITCDDYTGLDCYGPAAAVERKREISAGIETLSLAGCSLVPADDYSEESFSPCECCGDDLRGERHGIALIPARAAAAQEVL